jgi:hypothetical protein
MATNRKRVDPDALMKNMIGAAAEEDRQPDEKEKVIAASDTLIKKTELGRKPEKEKKSQVSIYLTEDQIIQIDEQTGIRKKERDKSALARVALEIVLSLSEEEYARLKFAAIQNETTPGRIVIEALDAYLK